MGLQFQLQSRFNSLHAVMHNGDYSITELFSHLLCIFASKMVILSEDQPQPCP
ncbi:MAG: hypothetical protein ACI87W_002355 [Halieaceae bacterium]|jgi:hypothetical protein